MPRKPKAPPALTPLPVPPPPALSPRDLAREQEITASLQCLVVQLEQRSLDNAVLLAQQAARRQGPLVAHFMELGRRYQETLKSAVEAEAAGGGGWCAETAAVDRCSSERGGADPGGRRQTRQHYRGDSGGCVMSAVYPSNRSIQHAIGVLERLPLDALFELANRLIDYLDTAEPDVDLEAETDACQAEDALITNNCVRGIGDSTDAEPDSDDEPDEDDYCPADEPHFSRRVPLVVQRPEPTKQVGYMRRRPRGSIGAWQVVR